MKLLRNNLYLIFNIILGFFIFTLFIYFKFLRARLPKDIPFNLSILGFFILIYICCIYGFVVYSLLKKNKGSRLNINWNRLYKPLEDFDDTIKNIGNINLFYKRFMLFCAPKLLSFFENNSFMYCIFMIIPRVILVSILVLDTFYFNKLYFIYKVLLVGLFIFIGKYLKYSLNKLKDNMIIDIQDHFEDISIEQFQQHHLEEFYISRNFNPDTDDEDDEGPPSSIYIPLNKFVEIYVEQKIYYEIETTFMFSWTLTQYNNVAKHYDMSPEEFLGSKNSKEYRDIEDNDIKQILLIATIIGYYDYYHNHSPSITKLKVLIFSNYLLCWLYILIVSIYTVDFDTIVSFLQRIQVISDPFTDITLEHYEQKNN